MAINRSKMRDYLAISLKSITQRRVRSWLTMVGIFIGIAAVVGLMSLGQGLQGAIQAQFDELGMNKIYVMPGGALFGTGGVDSLSEDDVKLIEGVRGVDKVGYYLFTNGKIEWDDELWWHTIMGMPTDAEHQNAMMVGDYTVEVGREFRKGEKYKAIIGYDYTVADAFNKHLKVGDKVIINGQEFDIIGQMGKIGNSQDDRTVIIPIDTARELLDIPTRLDGILVHIKNVDEVDIVADRIEKEMRKDRNQKEGDEDFTIQTIRELMDTAQKILNLVIFTLIGIAAISLVVGGIGIMNTMYTAVLQRTKEIGVMKAIGAKNSDVLQLFLLESGLLGIAGGIVGIIIGAGIGLGVSWAAKTFGGFELLEAHFPLWLIVGALAFSFLVGVLSGILPAMQAAKKNPADSLRYE